MRLRLHSEVAGIGGRSIGGRRKLMDDGMIIDGWMDGWPIDDWWMDDGWMHFYTIVGIKVWSRCDCTSADWRNTRRPLNIFQTYIFYLMIKEWLNSYAYAKTRRRCVLVEVCRSSGRKPLLLCIGFKTCCGAPEISQALLRGRLLPLTSAVPPRKWICCRGMFALCAHRGSSSRANNN